MLLAVALVALSSGFSSSARADTTTLLPFSSSSAGNIWLAVDDAHQHVFVSGGPATSSIVVLDYAGNIVKTITGEGGASEMALDPSTHTLYVALHDATAISKIDTATLTETGRFSTGSFQGPYSLVLVGGKLWFACAEDSTGCVASVNPDGTGLRDAGFGFHFPTLLAASPARGLLAVADSDVEPPTLSVYDVLTDPPSLVKSVWNPDGGSAEVRDITFDPSGSNLLLACGFPYFVESLYTDSLTSSAEYPTGPYPVATQTTADGDFVAGGISIWSPDLFVFPVGDTTPVKQWTLGDDVAEHALSFSPDRKRLFAVSVNGEAQTLTFNVLDAPTTGLPSVSLSDVTQIGSTGATLNGSVNPEGQTTSYHFEYGTTSAYGKSTAAASAGAGQTPVAVSASIEGLTPATTYHVRLVATNSAGTSATPDTTFTTGADTLTVTKEGTGSGTVTSSPAGINCGSVCTHAFADGSSVTLTAKADSGSAFTGWSGPCSGLGTCTLMMSGARSVIATFGPAEALTVAKDGDGSGTVTGSPAGIDCGSTCSVSYVQDTWVTLTATPDSGSTFTGWSGACTGTGSCAVQLSTSRSVTATFRSDKTLTVTRAGDGKGAVTSSPAGITCGSLCTHAFAHGTSVTLAATAAPGSRFSGWSDPCSGNGSCSLTLTIRKAVTATFQALCVVPHVTGKTLRKAQRRIRKAHCSVGTVIKAFSNKVRKGRVIAQKPRAGVERHRGSAVRLKVSKGKRNHRSLGGRF